MAIDRDKLLAWPFEPVEQRYEERDTILYALGLGLGAEPTDPRQLRFVYEKGLQALPSMGVILGYPGLWLSDPRTGADWRRLVHGEQSIEILKPLPASGRVVGMTRVLDVIDKGEKGALVFTRREVRDKASGDLLCRLAATTVLRADGGFGGPSGPVPAPHPLPDRPADESCALATLPQAALIYRLSGDRNPLHVDPLLAEKAGFPRPILHGLCTFGVVGHALLRTVCDYAPERLKSFQGRFTAPVFPGETIVTEIWREGAAVSFRARVQERGTVVLDRGKAVIAAAS
jgi:acyl dehydratase